MLKARLPLKPSLCLGEDGCKIADYHLEDMLSSLLLDPCLDMHQYKSSVQALRLTFWQGFWGLAEPDNPELEQLAFARQALITDHSVLNQEMLDQATVKGQNHVYDWAGPAWNPALS